MAILDDIEVQIIIPSLSHLNEVASPLNDQASLDTVPWAANSLRVERSVTAPPGRIFTICIRLLPSFDCSVGDGLHITLKIDDGATVNHYYSFKFVEMERDEAGGLRTVISNAIISRNGKFRKVLFSFADIPTGSCFTRFGISKKQLTLA